MKSIQQMLEQVEGLHDTSDLTEWENIFVGELIERKAYKDTKSLSPKQVEVIERIHRKHFA